MLLKESN